VNRATLLVLLGGLALTSAFALAPGGDAAGPFVPKSDAEVLEQVPRSTPRPTAPLSADEAAVRARQLIDEARHNSGDPRLLGRAQATLGPWWNEPSPPPRIRILRATIKQSFHDFEGALVDLKAQLEADPTDAQAWLTRATVLTVLARYPEAQTCCERLSGIADAVLEGICKAQLLGLTGQAKEAVKMLEALTPVPEERGRLLSVRGELEHWSGDDVRAQAALEQALVIDPTDTYSRLLLAQSLLDGGQPARAAKLFEGRSVNDGELLMLVLALAAGRSPEYAARRAELDERVAANRQRGETLHQREESRYALAKEAALRSKLTSSLEINQGAASCPLEWGAFQIVSHSDGMYLSVPLTARCPTELSSLEVRYSLLFDVDAQHRGLLSLSGHSGGNWTAFTSNRRTQSVTFTSIGGGEQTFLAFLQGMLKISAVAPQVRPPTFATQRSHPKRLRLAPFCCTSRSLHIDLPSGCCSRFAGLFFFFFHREEWPALLGERLADGWTLGACCFALGLDSCRA